MCLFRPMRALIYLLVLIPLNLSANNLKQIVFIGDSLTEGYGIPQEKSFPSIISSKFKNKKIKVKITNAGSSGSTSASAPGRVKWILKSNPNIVFIALGGNDGLRGINLQATENNLQQAITLALNRKIKVILAGVRIPTNYGPKYRKQFENIYISLAKKNNVTFIPYILKGVAGIKSLNLPDQIHPNEKGHQVIADNIFPIIEKLL